MGDALGEDRLQLPRVRTAVRRTGSESRNESNLFDVETTQDDGDPAGYETPYARIGPLIGASALGASVYVLNEGQSVCPYHWEAGDEEWLLVLEGRPELRTPEGEEELEPGDLVCFPKGPDGAHKVTNRRAEAARIVILSTKNEPGIVGLSRLEQGRRRGRPGSSSGSTTPSTTGKVSYDRRLQPLRETRPGIARTIATATGTARP